MVSDKNKFHAPFTLNHNMFHYVVIFNILDAVYKDSGLFACMECLQNYVSSMIKIISRDKKINLTNDYDSC